LDIRLKITDDRTVIRPQFIRAAACNVIGHKFEFHLAILLSVSFLCKNLFFQEILRLFEQTFDSENKYSFYILSNLHGNFNRKKKISDEL
jgi:hypothetical protein